MEWGLLGTEQAESERRSRPLGLGAAVRAFNELAVPGLGNAWFGRQLLLALLGIHLAERARAGGQDLSNIAAANAVEALAVWLSLRHLGWPRDARLPGRQKLSRHRDLRDLSFATAGTRSFYVTQPMRVGTLAPLHAFGLAEGESRRFNGYNVTSRGLRLLENAFPSSRAMLLRWVCGGPLPRRRTELRAELDPTSPLTGAVSEILRDGFLSGPASDRTRRREALAWIGALRRDRRSHTDWATRPDEIEDDAHWRDMRAGARFFEVVALGGAVDRGSVLDHLEAGLGAFPRQRVPVDLAPSLVPADRLQALRYAAKAFLAEDHDPSPDRMATAFCNECIQRSDVEVIRSLVARDGRILRLVDGELRPGGAFAGRPIAAPALVEDEEAPDAPVIEEGELPPSISFRVRNLYHLAPDLAGHR